MRYGRAFAFVSMIALGVWLKAQHQAGWFLCVVLAVWALMLWQHVRWLLRLLTLGVLLVLLWFAPQINHPFYFTLPVLSVFAWVGWQFGRTLLPHRIPLVQRFMTIEGRRLTPSLLVYARKVTGLWAFLMVFKLLFCMGLLFWHPTVWAWFTGLAVPVLDFSVLGIEFFYRQKHYPLYPRQHFFEFLCAMPAIWQQATSRKE